MRTALWILAVISAASPVRAQDVIEWSSERRLSRADFKGRVPSAAGNASMSRLSIDLSWGCEADELVASARATFDPSQSWWRPASANVWSAERRGAHRDSQLLEHEQVHFDLTEIFARRIRKRFHELKDACGEPGGADSVRDDIERINRDLQDTQRRYDRETGHGTNGVAQLRWVGRVRKLLGAARSR